MANVHIWQQAPQPITKFDGEQTADVVVVGAGIAGCAAAQAAAEAKASVIVIEKNDSAIARGVDCGAVDSILQQRAGIDIDKLDAARLIYAWSQQQANYSLIRTFVDRSGEVMSHYVKMAEAAGYTVRLNTETTARADWADLDDRFRMYRTAHVFDIPEGSNLPDRSPWNAQYVVDIAYKDACEHGAQFLFGCKAEQLLKSDGRIIGVAVSTPQGMQKVIATKGVILATGGITTNEEMKECFCPMTQYVNKNAYFPKDGNLGEGHIMAAWVGAAFSRCYPAPIIHPVNFTPLGVGIDSSWLSVNRDGKRFMNETAYEPIVTNARLNTPGNIAWAIWDADYLDHYKAMEPTKFSALPADIEDKVDECVAAGTYKRANSLAELAEVIGVPADNLTATVKRYNQLVDAGDDVDFGVPARFLSPCKKAPFYAGLINAELLSVLYGMRVDNNSQICDKQDDPIAGLYAVGAVQGDFFANSYPVTVPGADHGRAVTFGYLVGQALAQGKNIDGTPSA